MAGRRRETGIGWAVLPLVSWAFRHFLHWTWWEALLVAIPCAVIVGVTACLIRDTWPQEVPYDLADAVTGYQESGWRLARVHPWWDDSWAGDVPHVHLAGPDRSKMILIERDGAIQGLSGRLR